MMPTWTKEHESNNADKKLIRPSQRSDSFRASIRKYSGLVLHTDEVVAKCKKRLPPSKNSAPTNEFSEQEMPADLVKAYCVEMAKHIEATLRSCLD